MTADGWLIQTDHADGIVELTLNRAPVNALSAEFLFDFAARIEDLGQRDDVRGIVISSAFKVFSAGLDLKEALGFDAVAQRAIVDGLDTGFLALFACPKPTVAAVDGAAIAGGLFFVLASDHRVAGPRARFGLAEVRVGADFPVGPLEIARATLTPHMLRRLMLTGQPVAPEAALAEGIIDQLEADSDVVVARAIEAARMLAESPGATYASIKQQIRGPVIAQIRAVMAAGDSTGREHWFNAETKAAMERMLG